MKSAALSKNRLPGYPQNPVVQGLSSWFLIKVASDLGLLSHLTHALHGVLGRTLRSESAASWWRFGSLMAYAVESLGPWVFVKIGCPVFFGCWILIYVNIHSCYSCFWIEIYGMSGSHSPTSIDPVLWLFLSLVAGSPIRHHRSTSQALRRTNWEIPTTHPKRGPQPGRCADLYCWCSPWKSFACQVSHNLEAYSIFMCKGVQLQLPLTLTLWDAVVISVCLHWIQSSSILRDWTWKPESLTNGLISDFQILISNGVSSCSINFPSCSHLHSPLEFKRPKNAFFSACLQWYSLPPPKGWASGQWRHPNLQELKIYTDSVIFS